MHFFKDLFRILGQEFFYLLFAVVCLFGGIFAYFFVPETNRKSQDEIQTSMKNTWLHHLENPIPKSKQPSFDDRIINIL